MPKSNKLNKVYRVKSGIADLDGDDIKWGEYRLTAKDAESAIAAIKKNFQEGEYVVSVELVMTLDN